MPEDAFLSLLVPTRGRPEQLLTMISSVFETAARPDRIEVVLYVDDDDEPTKKLDFGGVNVVRLVGARRSMGIMNAACYARSCGEVVILGNDDMLARTEGWDDKIRSAAASFPDPVFLMYPNDLFKGERLAAFPILSRKTCDEVVDPFPGEYRGAFIDLHIMDVFRRLEGVGISRVRYLEDVVFEHLHYRTGKSDYDETYDNRDRFGDDETFMALSSARQWAANRLLNLISQSSAGVPTADKPKPNFRPRGGWFANLSMDILLDSTARFSWRLKLFCWLWLRFLYRKLRVMFRWSTR